MTLSLQNSKKLCALFPLLCAVGTAALYQGFIVRHHSLKTGKWMSGRRLRFVVVNDLHNIMFDQNQKKLLSLLREHAPDFILLPGDVFDCRRSNKGAILLLQGAAQIAPSYYVTGNHEYYFKNAHPQKSITSHCGVAVLSNTVTHLETAAGKLVLAGCDDTSVNGKDSSDSDTYSTLFRAFKGIADEPGYTLLLSHRPEKIPFFTGLGFDLVVSGHTHGGQVRLPGLVNGLYASGQGLLPKYTGGCYQHGNTFHIINRGLAVYNFIPRIFNPPEITVIDINGA